MTKLTMESKIKSISKINDDIKYLSEEYESIKLWGSCPDGDVNFFTLANWLCENKHVVEHIISTVEKIKALN